MELIYFIQMMNDVMSQDAHFSLKESESEEIARDKVRVGSSGGVWIDCV